MLVSGDGDEVLRGGSLVRVACRFLGWDRVVFGVLSRYVTFRGVLSVACLLGVISAMVFGWGIRACLDIRGFVIFVITSPTGKVLWLNRTPFCAKSG